MTIRYGAPTPAPAPPADTDAFVELDDGRDLAAEVAVDDDADVARVVALARAPFADLADDDDGEPF